MDAKKNHRCCSVRRSIVIMSKVEFYFRKMIGKIICHFRGHQMFCDIPTYHGVGETVLQRYDTTTCQRMCGVKL